MNSFPRYEDLPLIPELGVRHSWEVLPADAGTLSRIQPQHVTDAAGLVSQGLTIPLNLPIDAFDPPLFGRDRLRHTVVEATRIDAEDVIDAFNPQGSSQIDGLAHVRAREFGYFGGITELDEARQTLGMHHWARRGIAGRAVLLDMSAYAHSQGDDSGPFVGVGYDVEALEAVLQAQSLNLRVGDILLIRTGWTERFLALSTEERQAVAGWNGLRADEAMAEFLWNHGVALVGSDNPAVENGPGDRAIGSLHRRLLPTLGLPLMELLDFERLAQTCADRGEWAFFFVAVPMNLEGAVSSPANAMAIL
ncbi:cyclase family protein [Cryobacterium sp. TMS1-20-1]|uniref:cyclase family protein n=1 Tax=Cryobacterium sp. TMS1-20-1 TaxID=1259223 RepID=UPI00106BF712|nr:cyclase family protein [Cryobacterium sp. TMS1-20-1]TFC70955.1 cyclase family protein [Cryobacterium sp. TMS1-20-1]